MAQRVVTVNDVLDGHVTLDIECLDRIYLNAYVPILQTSAQVVAFLSGHLGFPFPSPVLFRQLGERFRKAVASFAGANDIPWVRFGKGEAKLEVMAPHLARQASTGRSGVAAIGVAQEFQRVWTAYEGKTSTGTPRWSFCKADRRVTCSCFYLWDADFGPYADRPVMPHRVPLCWSQRLPGGPVRHFLAGACPGHRASRKARRLSGGVYRPSGALRGASRASACSLSFMSACR
jgi:hypothetical protein